MKLLYQAIRCILIYKLYAMNTTGQKAVQVIIEHGSTKILSPVLQLSISTVDDILNHHFDVVTKDFKTKDDMLNHFLEFNYTYANEYGEDLNYLLVADSISNGLVTVSVVEFSTIEFNSSSEYSFSKQDKNLLKYNFNNFRIIAN